MSITDANDAIQRRFDRIDELRSQMNILKPARRYRVGRIGQATRDELRTSRRLSRMLYRLKYEELRLQERVKNMVHDMHHKVAKFLSEHYHQVLLPHFKTQGMVARSGVLGHRTRRMMLTLSHYKFKTILKEKMARTGGRVVDCDEWWTTKTCCRCGRINFEVTVQHFWCIDCLAIHDRDVHAAKNIFLMNEWLLEQA